MAKILYLTRNGLLEPLGRSQILPYLTRLASTYSITVVSFEKPSDWADVSARSRIRNQCQKLGITWVPLRFHSEPRPFAAIYAIFELFAVTLFQSCLPRRPDLIHARSYVPCAIALLHHHLTGVPFLFDMRALWPEELITAGRIHRSSWLHLSLIWLERRCLQKAAGVVSLTQAGLSYLQGAYPHHFDNKPTLVIPTCADLDRFKPAPLLSTDPIIIGCIGTMLSGWFRINWLQSFCEAILRSTSEVRFEFVTQDSRQSVLSILNPKPEFLERLVVHSARPDEMPSIIRRHTASVMFYAGGSTSELGRSPTRMAEVLGCGRPIITNPGIGDVEDVIKRHRVGIMVGESSVDEMDASVTDLFELLKDPQLSDRCRNTAKQLFSLEVGVSAYHQLYSDILTSTTGTFS